MSADVIAATSSVVTVTLALGGIGGAYVKRWINSEIVSKLSNDDTPVAKYAHDARDYAKQALDAVNQTNQILLDHVTNNSIHKGPDVPG